MKFRRGARSQHDQAQQDQAQADEAQAGEARPGEVRGRHVATEAPSPGVPSGPYDLDDAPDDGLERVDVGALLVAPSPGRELRLQVHEQSGDVAGVLLAGQDGAMEFQVFSAPRNGDLWDEVRPQIAADVTRRGGTVSEREGRWGTELECRVPVKRPDGTEAVQPSRIIGVNGPRWMLRASLLGRPALDPGSAGEWEDALAQVVVRRGKEAMPVGRPLGFTLPAEARRAT